MNLVGIGQPTNADTAPRFPAATERAPRERKVENVFYVYVLFDLDGTPCYIGKGSGDRWLDHERKTRFRNNFLKGIVRRARVAKKKLPKIKIREDMTQQEAWDLEIVFIAAIGRRNIGTRPLANLTDGGEGSAGMVFPESAKKLLSTINVGNKLTEEHKDNIRAGMKDFVPKIDHFLRYTESIKGKPKQWSDSGRESFINKQRSRYPGNRAGKPCSDATKSKLRELRAHQSPMSEDARAKISLAGMGNQRGAGRVWVTDGQVSRMVFPHEIPTGWHLGRPKFK
jgi:hypothetical protein